MKLAIVGWRGFTDAALFDATILDFVCEHGMPLLVISGGAKGADALGEAWARKHKIELLVLKPDWTRLKGGAGIARNTDIVAECTHMLAFPHDQGKRRDGTEKGGTQDSIRKARAQNKIVVIKKV